MNKKDWENEPYIVQKFFERNFRRYRDDFWSQLEAEDYRRRKWRTVLVLAAVLFVLLMVNTALILELMHIL